MPPPSPADAACALPIRLVSRLAMELHLNGIAALNSLSPRRYDRGVVLMVIARHCLADWTAGGVPAPPAVPARFTSINSTATSLGRPFETVRRHVHALADEGLCVVGRAGVALAGGDAAAGRVVAYLAGLHDILLRLAADMAALGLLPAATARPAGVVPLVLATALDLQLMPFENMRAPLPEWTSMLLWGVVSAACVRHVTTDPALSARYAHASTPDEARRPVPLATISRVSGVPPVTAWRHVTRLAERGRLARKADGWIVGTACLRDPAMEARVAAGVADLHRRLVLLIRAGLDPTAAPYLHGRPPLVPLG